MVSLNRNKRNPNEEAYWRFKAWRDFEREFRRGMEGRREG
jgi:hypothetical protein